AAKPRWHIAPATRSDRDSPQSQGPPQTKQWLRTADPLDQTMPVSRWSWRISSKVQAGLVVRKQLAQLVQRAGEQTSHGFDGRAVQMLGDLGQGTARLVEVA